MKCPFCDGAGGWEGSRGPSPTEDVGCRACKTAGQISGLEYAKLIAKFRDEGTYGQLREDEEEKKALVSDYLERL